MSGPAILAALVQQHAFEALYTREACRDLIEEYVRSGDGGSCGLSALEEDNEDEAECHDFLIFDTFFTTLDFVRPSFDRLTCPFIVVLYAV